MKSIFGDLLTDLVVREADELALTLQQIGEVVLHRL